MKKKILLLLALLRAYNQIIKVKKNYQTKIRFNRNLVNRNSKNRLISYLLIHNSTKPLSCTKILFSIKIHNIANQILSNLISILINKLLSHTFNALCSENQNQIKLTLIKPNRNLTIKTQK